MKVLIANAVLIVCLAGPAILAFGWIAYPALGTAVALLNAAFVLACIVAVAARMLNLSKPDPEQDDAKKQAEKAR